MEDSRNIYLVGLMGAGKTTLGKQLARRLHKQFYDSDQEIEARTGVRVPVIFEIEGEAGFRTRETEAIARLTGLDQVVLATGGGAVLDAGNRDQLKRNGFVLYLHAQPRDLWQRTRHDRNRPLLQTTDPLTMLEKLYELRDPLYRETADLVVDTGKQSLAALLRCLLPQLPETCKASA